MNAIINKKRNYSLAIPLQKSEIEKFDAYTRTRGLKKGHVVRKAILEYIDRHEKDQE